MTIPTLGTKGAQLNLLIKQGSTLGPNTMTLMDSSGAPMNLTGCTVKAEIRKTADAPTADASAICAVVGAAGGIVTWEFPAGQTELLSCDPNDENAPASQYVWDMELHYTSGRVVPLLYGNVSVYREVTKA